MSENRNIIIDRLKRLSNNMSIYEDAGSDKERMEDLAALNDTIELLETQRIEINTEIKPEGFMVAAMRINGEAITGFPVHNRLTGKWYVYTDECENREVLPDSISMLSPHSCRGVSVRLQA